jgi:hypothetical protein
VSDFFNNLDFVALSVDESFAWDKLKGTFALMRDFDLDFHERALICFWGIGRKKGKVSGEVFVDFEVGQPFKRVRGYVKRVKNKQIISVRGLLFPHFVLVVDDHLLFFVELWIRKELPSDIGLIVNLIIQSHSINLV